MKIITLGLSPYLITSHARIHGLVLRHLFLSGHSIAGMVSNHDTQYFIPEEIDGVKSFYYNFDKYKIPIIPFDKDKQPEILIYEILNKSKPDIVVTIGDYNDFLFMKAVKMFCETPFTWIFILMNHTYPINEKNKELIDDIDGIVCTSKKSYTMFRKIYSKDNITYCSVGAENCESKQDLDKIRSSKNLNNSFRIMSCGKNAQIDNLPSLIQAVSELRKDIPNIQLYLHTNFHDVGDFDLQVLIDRFDPNSEFIKTPDKYVSLTDGYSSDEYKNELLCSDMFVSVSMNSSSGMSVLEAISYGCYPLMSNTGAHVDIGELISNSSIKLDRNDVLVPCINLMATGECYLDVCDSGILKEYILNLYHKIMKKAGHRTKLVEIIKNLSQKDFADCIAKLIMNTKKAESAIHIELIQERKNG